MPHFISAFLRSPQQQPKRSRSAIAAEQAPPHSRLLAAAKTRTTARPKLRRVLLYLVDRLAEPSVP